jgi:lysophospholipase L1-like esterase
MPPALAQVQFKHLAFIGDSITVGVAASAQRLTYQQRVLVAVGATQSSTLAHSGWTTFDALTALTSRPETVADADVIIVELGTNDDSPRQSGTEGDWQATYSILLSLVRRDAPPDARLICLTPWRGSAEKGAHGVPSTHYAAWVAAACFANGGISVRLAPLYDDPANRTPPDFHPNDRGHGAIAAAILAVLGVRTT